LGLSLVEILITGQKTGYLLQLSTFQQDNKKNYEINLEFNIEAKWRNSEI
jgi:hypothetical protein